MARKHTSELRSPQEIIAALSPRECLPRRGRAARELVHHLKENLAKDLSEPDLAAAMGLTVQRLRTLMERMYAGEEEVIRGKTAIRLFIDFMVRQLACIRRLDAVAAACLAGNQAAGAVGAVKAKADLYDRILTRGQELGVLARRPKEVQILGRIDVRHMTTEDLKRQVAAENKALLKLAASLDAPAEERALLAEAAEDGAADPDAPSSDPGER